MYIYEKIVQVFMVRKQLVILGDVLRYDEPMFHTVVVKTVCVEGIGVPRQLVAACLAVVVVLEPAVLLFPAVVVVSWAQAESVLRAA